MSYPSWIVLRAGDVARGIPGKFKFCPQIADMKETFDGWVEAQSRADDLRRRFSGRPVALALPRPYRAPDQEFGAMVARHGRPIGAFEQGTKWERFAGRRSGVDARSPDAVKIVQECREAMERRGEAAE